MYGLYFVLFILFVVGPLLGSLYLTRKWSYEEAGRDLDEEALLKEDVVQIPRTKQFLILLLWLPAGLFLIIVLLYMFASIVIYK
jgi:hypothetical protein